MNIHRNYQRNLTRFLKKYLIFLEELSELFGENWSKFLTAGVSSFLKALPGCRVSRHNEFKYFVSLRSIIWFGAEDKGLIC